MICGVTCTNQINFQIVKLAPTSGAENYSFCSTLSTLKMGYYNGLRLEKITGRNK